MRFTASSSDAPHVRKVLSDLGAFYTERRHWIFWREFIVTGPAVIMGALSEAVSDARIAADYGGAPAKKSATPARVALQPGSQPGETTAI